jgi:hypothetical protein
MTKTLDEMAKFLAAYGIRLGIASRQVAGGLHVYQATLTESDGRLMGIGQDPDLAKAVEDAINERVRQAAAPGRIVRAAMLKRSNLPEDEPVVLVLRACVSAGVPGFMVGISGGPQHLLFRETESLARTDGAAYVARNYRRVLGAWVPR